MRGLRQGSNASTDDILPQRLLMQTTHRRSSVPDVGPVAKLVYSTYYGSKMEFQLVNAETNIGRREDNHIVLHDGKISKHHAVVVQKDGSYYIKDSNSSNGVRVNDTLIEPNTLYPLNNSDSIQIGSVSLVFTDVDDKPIENKYLDLVTILPSDRKYEETVHIRAELEAQEEEVDFKSIKLVENIHTLKEDYEKLRLAYELSKMSVNDDINKLLAKSMDLIFEILPVDRGVVLLVDQATGFLSTHYVKLRQGKDTREILLSSTILNKVYYSRKCLITSDAFEDPMLGKAASVRHGQIRSVICVPLMSHNRIHGILHLDSKDRITAFSSKDLSLVKTISCQTSLAIENMSLMKEVEQKAKLTEQLSRFLPPHVIDKMSNPSEMIRKGGRETMGTIVFADIRGFTKLSEKCSPMEVVHLLNDYFERLVKIVFKYDGIVDKYIGDALMACFGTLEGETDSEFRATACALEFQTAIKEMNEERKRVGKEPVAVGVGLNTGVLLAGFIGSSQRLEYTCIGDTVNTSSRICSQANEHQVLLSETTYEYIKDRIHCRPVGYHQFKGKERQVLVYEALSFN